MGVAVCDDISFADDDALDLVPALVSPSRIGGPKDGELSSFCLESDVLFSDSDVESTCYESASEYSDESDAECSRFVRALLAKPKEKHMRQIQFDPNVEFYHHHVDTLIPHTGHPVDIATKMCRSDKDVLSEGYRSKVNRQGIGARISADVLALHVLNNFSDDPCANSFIRNIDGSRRICNTHFKN